MRFEFQKKSACIAVAWFVAGLLLTGCAANQPPCTQFRDPQPQITLGVDAQDLMTTADAAVASLLESGVFDRGAHHPAVLSFGRFVNNTVQNIDMTLLTGQICATLVKTGKVAVAEKGHNAVDSSSRSDALLPPDFTLSGSVVETRERSGGINQSTYTFQYSLADSNNLIIWAENKTINKTTRRNPGL